MRRPESVGPEVGNKGPLIARGRTAEVFSWSTDQVVKLFYSWCSPQWIDLEAANSRIVSAKGLPTPGYLGTVTLEGRAGIVYQKVSGPSLLAEITRRPWKIRSLARLMGRLHAEIHSADGSGLPSLRSYLQTAISGCERLSPQLKQRVLQVLATLKDGGALCHLDFHPDQIVLSGKGPLVIDWMTAHQGNPVADLARTLIITRFGSPPHTNWLLLRVMDLMRQTLIDAYLRQYLAQRPGTDRRELLRWTVPLAAARLADELPEEEVPLKHYIEKTLRRLEGK